MLGVGYCRGDRFERDLIVDFGAMIGQELCCRYYIPIAHSSLVSFRSYGGGVVAFIVPILS